MSIATRIQKRLDSSKGDFAVVTLSPAGRIGRPKYFTSEEEQNAHFNNLKPETKPLTYCFCRRSDSWMES